MLQHKVPDDVRREERSVKRRVSVCANINSQLMLNALNVLLFVVGVPINEKFILGNKSKECKNFFLSIYFALDINSEILPNIVFPEVFQQQVIVCIKMTV